MMYSSLIVRAEMSLRYLCELGSRSYVPPTLEPDGSSYRDADLLLYASLLITLVLRSLSSLFCSIFIQHLAEV